MSISSNLLSIKQQLPNSVTLVAVSKTIDVERIMEAYDAGQRIFGENKVQEMVGKWEQMPKDIEWHMIGHLQTNKVKYIAPFVKLIHAVDSMELLIEINKQAKKHNRVIDCLLQIRIAEEETKFGMTQSYAENILQPYVVEELENVKIIGLMGMATFTDNQIQIKNEFLRLKMFFELLKSSKQIVDLCVLSMGMSGDYKLAIEAGSTLVRIGSNIFGSRN